MKKILSIFVLGFTLVLLGACSQLNQTQFSLDTDEEVFSMSALSTSSLLVNEQTNDPLLDQSNDFIGTLSLETNSEVEDSEVETDETNPVDNAEKFLNLIEKFASGQAALQVESEVSDNAIYEHKLTFTTMDMLGEQVTYTLYYNETLEDEVDENDDQDEANNDDSEVDETNQPDDVDDADDDQDDQDELDDEEKEYTIEGILVVNDQTFEVIGEKEIEEDEQEIKFTAFIDEFNYVTSKYELESDETKFYIEEVKDGVLYAETEIKIETEDDETKIELEYRIGNDTFEYEFKYEIEDQRPIIKVEFETTIDGVEDDGEMYIYIIVDDLTGETSYEIAVDQDKDGEIEDTYSKDRDDDDDED